MKITLKVQRFDPQTDSEPHYKSYDVEVEPTDRILDAMMFVKRFIDGSLGFRKSCAHGVCGSDAMRINGKDGLACKTLVQDVAAKDGDTILIEPLRHFPVQRDLIVDQQGFFERYRAVSPFLINDEPVTGGERIQSPEERLAYDEPTNCILCASCFSACPIPGGQTRIPGSGGDHPGIPLSCRLTGQGIRCPPARAGQAGGRMVLPKPLQVHRGLPALDQDHQTDQSDQTDDQEASPGKRRIRRRRRRGLRRAGEVVCAIDRQRATVFAH